MGFKPKSSTLSFWRCRIPVVGFGPDEFRKIGAKPVWDDWVKSASQKGVPAQELLDLILSTAGG